MDVTREEVEQEILRRSKAFGDNVRTAAVMVADALEFLSRDRMPEPVAVKREDDAPTDDQLAAWVERNPKAFADWAARQAQAAKPATRRRTAR